MSVLVVEDNPSVASVLQRGLEREGYSVDLATDGTEALAMGIRGMVSLMTTVEALGALMPETAWLFMYFAIAVALDALTFANPLQNLVNPAMVSS